jgi:hypothetical protein
MALTLAHPKCRACRAAVGKGRPPVLVNGDHREALRWKEPHLSPEEVA